MPFRSYYAFFALLITYGCKRDHPLSPVVKIELVQIFDLENALVAGKYENLSRSAVVSQGFCWANHPSPTLADRFTGARQDTIGFSTALMGLGRGQKLYLRAYAADANQIYYSDDYPLETHNFSSIWEHSLLNASYQSTSGVNIFQDGDGYFYYLTHTIETDGNFSYPTLLKIDVSGHLVWRKDYYGMYPRRLEPFKMVPFRDGWVIATTQFNNPGRKTYLLFVNAAGELSQQLEVATKSEENILTLNNSGDTAVGLVVRAHNGFRAGQLLNPALISYRCNQAGSVIIDSNTIVASSKLAELNAANRPFSLGGDEMVLCMARQPLNDATTYVTAQKYKGLQLLWEKTYNHSGKGYINGLSPEGTGKMMLIGSKTATLTSPYTGWALEVDQHSGEPAWQQISDNAFYGAATNSHYTGSFTDINKQVYVTGFVGDSAHTTSNWMMAKLDAKGVVRWQYVAPDNGGYKHYRGVCMFVDRTGSIFIFGDRMAGPLANSVFWKKIRISL